MKHFYFLTFFFAFCSIARAQVNKGSIVVGGNIGFYEQSTTGNGTTVMPRPTSSSNNLYINPSLGKAIRDNLVLGVDLSYSRGSSSGSNAGESTGTYENDGFRGGVFLRRYRSLGSGFFLFGQTELAFTYSHGHASDLPPGTNEVSDQSNSYGASLQLYPGIAYFLNRHWQIETGLPNFLAVNYSHYRDETVYTAQPAQSITAGHSFNFASSLTGNNQFTVGIRYFIGSF